MEEIESIEIIDIQDNTLVDGTEAIHTQKESDEKSYKTTVGQIKDYTNAFILSRILNNTYYLDDDGSSETYFVTASDTGTYFKANTTFNNVLVFNPDSLEDEGLNGWVVLNSNADGGINQVVPQNGTTFNVKDIGEQVSSVINVEKGGAVVIKRNGTGNFDIIGDVTI